MAFISKLKDWFSHEPFACECGFQPDNPKSQFEINREESRFGSDFKKYDCPQCEKMFQAIFCNCGRGYTSRMDFNRVTSTRHGEQETYKCDCGETLHVHQRI